ncbi:OLC1v1011264C1 [Oldenlandia corymbosa var. corymbosa]|uniref:OLC1v1011264C1 n=1 Tax=Oldenlandia corymbosa var. corymbosa TaxID=529605 RepID=A0AAV1DUZ0_OLDCO|nr:OLC1v1011264C1 [Oldenlandia corymbosa var. corymbosa]
MSMASISSSQQPKTNTMFMNEGEEIELADYFLIRTCVCNSGLRDYPGLSLKVSPSDETSVSSYAKDGPDGVITIEEPKPVEKPVEKEEYEDKVSNAAPEETPSEENPDEVNITQVFESFLEKLDLEKIDADDKYSLLLLGAGGLTALYLATAIVGAIDSIPLVPKLMQLVGLSYTVWFTARYLVLKKNRAELAATIKDIKEKVLGSDSE